MKKSIKTKVLSLVASFAMVLSLLVLPIGVHAEEGTAEVSNRNELIAALSEDSITKVNIVQNIDLDSEEWIGITIGENRNVEINGNGYTISNMKVRKGSQLPNGSGIPGDGGSCDYYAGWIANNKGNLTINNLKFDNADVDINPLTGNSTGSSILAVVVANNTGKVILNDVDVNNSIIKGYSKVGALHGFTQGEAFNANHCSVTNTTIVLEGDGTDPEACFGGFIAGYNGKNLVKTKGIKLVNNKKIIDDSVKWDIEMSTTDTTDLKYVNYNGIKYGMITNTYTKDGYGMEEVQFATHVGAYGYETLEDAKEATKVTNVTLTEKATIKVGETLSLKAVTTPAETAEDITWTSKNPEIVKVDDKGIVTGLKIGSTEITVQAGDKKATCEVTVYEVEEPTLPKEDIQVNEEAKEVIGNTTTSIVEAVKQGEEVKNVEFVSDEAKDTLKNATNITTEVVAEPVNEEKVEKAAIKAIDQVLIESDKANNNKSKVLQYLDLSVLLKADDTAVGNITELTKKITFNVEVPKEVQKDGLNFYIVRFHDGKAERLDGTFDEEKGIVSFMTDKFSTYALVSEEKVKEEPQVEYINMTLAAVLNGKAITGEDLVEIMKLGGVTDITVDDLTEKVEKGYALTKEEVVQLEDVMKQFKDEELVFKGFFVDKDGKVKLDESYVFDKDTTVYMIFETKDGDMSVVPTPGDKEDKPVDTNNPTPKPTEKDETVKTDDESNMMLYASFAGLALIGGAILVLSKKREELMK